MNIHEMLEYMENIETIIPAPQGMKVSTSEGCIRRVVCLALFSDTEKHIEPMVIGHDRASIIPASFLLKDPSCHYSIFISDR